MSAHQIWLGLVGLTLMLAMASLLNELSAITGRKTFWFAIARLTKIGIFSTPFWAIALYYSGISASNILFSSAMLVVFYFIFGTILSLFMALLGPPASVKVNNERIRLTAASLDRASTVLFTVGVAGPLIGSLLTSPHGQEISVGTHLGIASCIVAGVALHLIARRTLGGIRDES